MFVLKNDRRRKNDSCIVVREMQEPNLVGLLVPCTEWRNRRPFRLLTLMDQLLVLQFQQNVQELLRNGSRLLSLVYIQVDMDAIQQVHMDYRNK